LARVDAVHATCSQSALTTARHGRSTHGGAATSGLPTVEKRRGSRGNAHWIMAYTPLHQYLERVAGKRGLTSEAIGAAVTDGAEAENRLGVEEKLLG
jgi:hypothetical protein